MHEYGLTIHEMPYLKTVKHFEAGFTRGGKPPITYSPDGRYIAVHEAWITIYDSETLEELPEEREVTDVWGSTTCYDWRVQRYIVVGTNANLVALWNFERGESEKTWKFKFKEYTYPEQVLMHPSGKTIFAMYMEHGVATLNI